MEERRQPSVQFQSLFALGSPPPCASAVTHRTDSCRVLRGRKALSSLRKVCSLLMTRSTAESGLNDWNCLNGLNQERSAGWI
jgi:hypothetical protein